MKTFFSDIIPKLKRYGEKLDNLTLLTNQHWVVIDELRNSKLVYIFRSNNDLLISQNGKVEKGKWEYLGNNSLLIEKKDESYLFRHGFFDANILALKVDGVEEFAFLVNENRYKGDLNSIAKVLDFLESKYLKIIPDTQLNSTLKQLEGSFPVYTKNYNLFLDNDSKYGYVNKEGVIIIECKYDYAYDFSEGFALVANTDNKTDYYGYINENGNEIIKLQFEFGENFSEGLALVRLNRKFGYLNIHGNTAIDFIFDDADSFIEKRARVKRGGRTFYIDLNGNET